MGEGVPEKAGDETEKEMAMSAADRANVTGIDRVDGDIERMQVAHELRNITSVAEQIVVNGTVYYMFAETDRGVQRESLPPSPVAAIQLSDRFVAPRGFDRATRFLSDHRSVLLDGKPGSGRRTAALKLFEEFGAGDGRYRNLSLADQEKEDSLNPDAVQPGEPLLLDLSGTDDVEVFVANQDKLLGLRTKVVDQEAALVVIPPAGVGDRLRPEWEQLSVTIHRPDGAAVLAKHLSAEGMRCGAEDLRKKDFLRSHLSDDPMRELAGICRRALEARDSEPKGSFETWLRNACRELNQVRKDIAESVGNWSGDQRALALAAAVLRDSHPDSVHRAAIKLRACLAYPNNPPHILEQAGLDTLLLEVGASTNERGEVVFNKTDYASGVREYFWKNFPNAREGLRRWIGDCIADSQFSKTDRDRMVARFAEQARLTGRIEDLCDLAYRLASRREGAPRTGAWAASALAYGIQDDSATGAGAIVRRRIYDWCGRANLSQDLAQVLVTVCADVMAENHPEQAIVRLRRLTMHDDAEVARSAADAVKRLSEEPRFYRRFLWWMRNWLSEGSKNSDVELFLTASVTSRLVERNERTQALAANRGVQRLLVVCWGAVFAAPAHIWVHKLPEWLDVARSRLGTELLDVVVEATGGERANLAVLHVAARDWATAANDPEDRASRLRLTRSLAMKIDAAQGLQLNKRRMEKW